MPRSGTPKINDKFLKRFGNLLGRTIRGDVGDFTLYTTKRGKLVWFPISPPKKPPSSAQLLARGRFTTAQRQWAALSKTLKAEWETLVLRNSLCMTGQNLYISLAINPDPNALTTANKRAGLSLSAPTPVP